MIATGKKRILRAAKIGMAVIWWSFVTVLAVLLVNIFAAKMSGKVPHVFGYSVMNIVSGSMEDEIPQGSYIIIKRVDPEEICKGDIICFYSTDPLIYGLPNTHRVVEEPILSGGEYFFVTRGDANPTDDKVLAEGSRLIGVYVTKFDGLNAFASLLDKGFLMIVIIVLQIAMTCMIVYGAVVTKKEKTKGDGSRQ